MTQERTNGANMYSMMLIYSICALPMVIILVTDCWV
jgi:hypothetical protein